ncbi:MAG: DnaJ domain-containing protein, partial [Porticoccaceae bacterium]|nr:DnaJ domain-containing protein [Porticoccaceae bacterium]
QDGNQANNLSELSEKEAYEILGLEADAPKDDIIKAHKRLMQRMHPDRGGSDYLAAKINAAKDKLV